MRTERLDLRPYQEDDADWLYSLQGDASAAVCERLGMGREAHIVSNEFVKGEWCDGLHYALLAEERRASRVVDDGPLSASAPA